jgi:chorismate mutase
MAHSSNPALDALRTKIDDVDNRLIDALADRFRLSRDVGALKARQHLPLVDAGRESVIGARIRQRAEARGAPADLVAAIYRLILDQVAWEHRSARAGP